MDQDAHAVFGVSLGTASAAIAASKRGKVEVLANHAGERTTPTLVSYQDNGIVIGHSAKQSLHRNAKKTASHMSLLIGKDFDDEDVRKITSSLMCEVGRGEGGRVCYVLEVDGKQKLVPVSDTLTHILKSLYETQILTHELRGNQLGVLILSETAGSFSSSSKRVAVVAVPAGYTTAQRNAVRACSETAGFDVMRIVSEPAAICLAHGIGQSNKTEKSYVLVYNLGAHTLTLTLLLVTSGMYSEMVTRCMCDVGGRECDKVIADFLTAEFERQWKVSIRGNTKSYFKLLAAAESAKHALSTVQTTSVHLESLHDGLDFTYSLSRGRFEGLCTPVFRRCVDSAILSALLSDGQISKNQLDHVVLAGGSCKIPHLQKLLGNEFPTSEIHSSPPPDEAIAMGCALQASIMQRRWESGRDEEGEEGVTVQCVPHDLWIKGAEVESSEQLLLTSRTALPCHNSLSLSLSPPLKTSKDVCCLELWEKSTNHEREIAKFHVPVSGEDVTGATCEGVRVNVTILWTEDNVVTITIAREGSDWKCSASLTCKTE